MNNLKNIIIVGGSEGIGFETARLFLKNGIDKLCIASRSITKLYKAKEILENEFNRQILVQEFDISQCDSHNNFIQITEYGFGSYPDALVISSGVHKDSGNWKGFNMSEKDFDTVMNVNLKGVFFLIRNFSNYIIKNQKKASICVVSSQSAHRDLLGAYQISKNAISGIIHAYGKHLFERGITLTGIEPGLVDTPMMSYFRDYTDGIREGKLFKDNSIHRLIRPDEIANYIVFLINDTSGVLAGTVLLANGGAKSIHIG